MLVMKEVTEKSAEYPEIEILYKEAFPKKERSLLKYKYKDKTISLVIEPVEIEAANYEQRRKRRSFKK